MRNLQFSQCNLIRSPKFKIGHHDPLKVNLDSLEIQDVSYTHYPQGVYTTCVIAKLIELGHIDLLK